MIEIYTIGYGGKRPHVFLDELEALNADLVVDVRRDALHAFLGVYTAPSLKKRLKNYVWLPELGNRLKTLPPELVDQEKGLDKLLTLIGNRRARRVVLLCAEKDEVRCHRKYVKEAILKNWR